MTGWADLDRELDLWGAAGEVATFWLRDDDAYEPTPGLDRLLALSAEHGVVPLLAVVPARATRSLAQRLSESSAVAAQHGYIHANHAWHTRHKAEFGPERSSGEMLGELARGAGVMDDLFGLHWLRVFVPPFNRIAPDLADALPTAGYVGLSRDAPRRLPSRRGFVETNTHVDIMDWKARTFGGEVKTLDRAIAHLAARRERRCDHGEPTGLLTHYWAHDEAAWTFIATFFARTRAHRAARWLVPSEAFAATSALGVAV